MQGIHQREGKTRQTWSVMVVAFLALFSQIGAMVLLIAPEWIKLESCACVQIEARGAGNRWVHSIRYFCFIRKAGYCIVKKSLPFWSSFWISFAILPPISAILPRWRVSLCYFLLALWVILGETNYMTQMCFHTHMQAFMHAHTRAHTHTLTHMHTHAHTCRHSCMCALRVGVKYTPTPKKNNTG